MSERKPHKTDLSDEQWALIVPVIAAWKARQKSTGPQARPDLLRWQVREKARRKADPSLMVLDTQSVHAAATDAASTTTAITRPDMHDNAAGIALLDKVAADTDTVQSSESRVYWAMTAVMLSR
ncbi:hypothetical protein [Streptomyces sp. NBC_01276]|uniref:hypothetical protein n=1 Tax=Streptomyces sp. NBC_01276 TaxID=2903808 RepID=UPI002F91AF2B